MKKTILVRPYNESFVILDTENSVALHIKDRYTYEVDDFKKKKTGVWDGKVYQFSPEKKLFPFGLLASLTKFAEKNDYFVDFSLMNRPPIRKIDLKTLEKFEKHLNLSSGGKRISMFDHQKKACLIAINNEKCVIKSPTSSGKSLSIFFLTQWFRNKKILVLVPNKTLVEQLFSDFHDYSSGSLLLKNEIGKVHGESKNFDCRVTISTWQSLMRKDRMFFEQFDVLIVDECHHAQSVSIKKIAERCINASIRIGFTGTLDKDRLKRCTITGVLGPEHQIVSTAELMEKNLVAELMINCLVLEHPRETKQRMENLSYHEKIVELATNLERNLFICNLACSKPNGNVIVLFSLVDDHGKLLYEICQEKLQETGRKAFFVHGGVKVEERESIRKAMEESVGNVLIASYGTMSTGTSIKNLHYGIFATAFKSEIRNLQSIGRLLRVHKKGKKAVLYDIGDDAAITIKNNIPMRHFAMRLLHTYKKEGFDYRIQRIKLKGDPK